MRRNFNRGVSLIDTVIGIALLVIIFAGTAAALEISLDVIVNNRARAGATALADERIEYIRSLPFASVGTVGGVPSGTIAQSEALTLNNISYTRRTYIDYEDDPSDGLGGADTDGILDYKGVKVDVSWISRTGIRHVIVDTRISTPVDSNGNEINPCSSPCGTLAINVANASSQPVLNAQVTVVNPSTSPAINLTTYTDASGTASVIGAPVASGYQVSVTKTGYSTAQTYSSSAGNTNPTPANLTVTNGNTTSISFAIDALGTKTIQTFNAIASAIFSDPYSDTSKIASSTNITVSGGVAQLTGSNTWGEVRDNTIQPSTLATWGAFNATSTKPTGTSILYRFYDLSGNLIPDTVIPGNSAGITASSVDLSGVSTSTYQGIAFDATLTGPGSATPSIDSYQISYTYGPTPLPNIPFTLQGAKTIGSGPPLVYKYSSSLTSGSGGGVTLSNLEWDTYTLIVPSSSGYDIASACHPTTEQLVSPSATTQFALQPGSNTFSQLYLAPHTTNSLLVEVRSAATGADLPGATVMLTGVGTKTSDQCGQVFFSGLSATSYAYTISNPGNTTANGSVNVSGSTRVTVTLN